VLFALTLGLKGTALVPVGPGFYPRIVLGITAVLAAWVLLQSFWKAARAGKGDENYALVAGVFAIFFLYVGALPFLGFRLSTLFFMLGLQPVLGSPRGAKGWLVVGATALITTVVSYILFEHYLQVLLPRGRWTDF
jgi:hypothetical protein